jgi:hypothetical protein
MPSDSVRRGAWRMVSSADFLQETNGITLKTKSGGKFVEEGSIIWSTKSTMSSLFGTCTSLLVLLLFTVQIMYTFSTQEPQINAVESESLGTAFDLPDIALTFNYPNMSEKELMSYAIPQFWWRYVGNGFVNRTNGKQLMNDEVLFGHEACNLDAGYNVRNPSTVCDEVSQSMQQTNCEDSGPATWPVFCIKRNGTFQLQGRFGDDIWRYLQVV